MTDTSVALVQYDAGTTLEKLLGFSLHVEASSIANAGEGVKLIGKAPIGSVVVRPSLLDCQDMDVCVCSRPVSLINVGARRRSSQAQCTCPSTLIRYDAALFSSVALRLHTTAVLTPGSVDAHSLVQVQHLREISDNPYARARFDSVVIDAKRECT